MPSWQNLSTGSCGGNKYVAETIFYNALDIINQKTHADPAKTFKQAMENVKPVLEVRPRRVGGRHVPSPCGSEAIEKNCSGHSLDY